MSDLDIIMSKYSIFRIGRLLYKCNASISIDWILHELNINVVQMLY